MRALYSDAMTTNRLLAMRLAHLIWGAEPLVRLAIIEAIEETGNVLFALTTKIATAYQRESGTELRYCGEFHFQLESGHAMNNDHAVLAGMTLDDATCCRAIDCADQAFAWFEDWTRELHRYGLAQLGETAEAMA